MSLLHPYIHLAILGMQANRCTQGENVREVVLLEHMVSGSPFGCQTMHAGCCLTPWIEHALLGIILSLSVYLAIKELNLKVPSNCLSYDIPCLVLFRPHLDYSFFWFRATSERPLVWFGSWFVLFVGLLNHRTNSFL